MEDVSNTLQQMQEKEDNTTEDLINLKNVSRWRSFRWLQGADMASTKGEVVITLPYKKDAYGCI
jgi:hypothetical protein